MIPWAKPYLFGDEQEYLIDAIKSTWISGGPYIDRFEKEFSNIFNIKNTITTSNGTTALTLALLALDIKEGDEVIVPGFCFVAAANTVLQLKAKPVYADVDKDTWNIDPESIKKLITEKTKAIITVHNYGNVCNMNEIIKIAKENNLYVIEDVAEAAFSKHDGKYAGTFGDIGCFSFQATKIITMGEGGAVITDNDELAEKMKKLKNHGMTSTKYLHDRIAYNFRLTNLQASLGYSQLKKLPLILKSKKRVYNSYLEKLKNIKGITLQKIQKETEPIIWAIAIKIDQERFGERDRLIERLLNKGIETRPGFYPFSSMTFYNAPENPIANSISKNIIVLPSFPSIKEEEINYICEQLKKLGEFSLEVPLPEILDKISIVKLKIERVGEPHLQKELEEYQKALKKFEEQGIKIKQEWIRELYKINAKIWDLEGIVRNIVNLDNYWEEAEKIGLEEIGKRLIKVEELMKERIEIKNRISEKTGSGFKEIKIDHCGEEVVI